MSQLINHQVVSDRAGRDGRRRVKIRVVLEDNHSEQHDEIKTLRRAAVDFDASAWVAINETNILDARAEAEELEAENIDYHDSPLALALDPKWSTGDSIAKKLIRWMMREKDPRIVLYLEPLIVYIQQNYNATQIADLLDITAAEVLRMNRRVNAILSDTGTAKDLLADFDAEQGEVG